MIDRKEGAHHTRAPPTIHKEILTLIVVTKNNDDHHQKLSDLKQTQAISVLQSFLCLEALKNKHIITYYTDDKGVIADHK